MNLAARIAVPVVFVVQDTDVEAVYDVTIVTVSLSVHRSFD